MTRRRLVSGVLNRILQREFKKSFIKARREPNEIVNQILWVFRRFLDGIFGVWALSFSAFILPKSKKTQKRKTCRSSMQSFVILGSLLQWRWLRASIGHFVFLLFSNLKLPNNNHVCSSFQGL